MANYQKLALGSFDNKKCVESILKLKSDPTNEKLLEETIALCLPVVGRVLHLQFRWLRPGMEVYDDAPSMAAIKLYTFFTSEKFRTKDYYYFEQTIFAFLYNIFRHEIVNSLRKVTRATKDYSSTLTKTTLDDVEYAIFASQLPQEVLRIVKEKIRFSGEDREQCELIASSLIDGTGVPLAFIKTRWGSKGTKFFSQYVRVLIRSALLQVREQANAFPSLSSDISSLLDNSAYAEGFSMSSWFAGDVPLDNFGESDDAWA